MAELRFALIGEGSTDEALLPIIQWLLREHLSPVDVVGIWANRARTPVPQPRTLAERIASTIAGIPCDVLFVHRDADRAGRDARVQEIERAVELARQRTSLRIPIVPVVPIRMREAWLLTNPGAIRRAAGNPNGRMPLNLPRLRDLERLADPKAVLTSLILTATGLNAHRRQRFEVDTVVVAEKTSSFEVLRQLPAFRAFEEDVRRVIAEQGWPERLG